MMARVRVLITLKNSVLDPQGSAVERSLHTLGYDEVRNVRVGRMVELQVEDGSDDEVTARVEQMCEQLLANPVIESWRIERIAEPALAGAY